MKFRETQGKQLDEASGTYHGTMYQLNGVSYKALFIFGIEVGQKKIKYGTQDAGVFIKDEDKKKLNTLGMIGKSTDDGEYSFATDEYLSDKMAAKHPSLKSGKKSKRK